jgi:hypothetical protein
MGASSEAVVTARIAPAVIPPAGGWPQRSTMKPGPPSRFSGRIRTSRAGCVIRGSRASPGEPSRCTRERLGNVQPVTLGSANSQVVLPRGDIFPSAWRQVPRTFYSSVEFLHSGIARLIARNQQSRVVLEWPPNCCLDCLIKRPGSANRNGLPDVATGRSGNSRGDVH